MKERFRDDANRTMNSIYEREYVYDYLKDLTFEYFSSLVYSNIVSVCGGGYLFDNGRIKITEEQRDKVLKLTFGI